MDIGSKKYLTMALLVGSGLFVGCTGSDVSIVKEFRMKGWPDYTIGQMLDKRKACSKTDWKSFKDDRDRVIVEYTCVHGPGTKYIQELNVSEIDRGKNNPPKMATYELNSKKKSIESYRKQLQDEVERGASPSQMALTERILESHEQGYLRIKQEEEEILQRAQVSHAEMIALLERRAANFEEINEVFQWVIQEKSPVFLTSQIKVKFSDAAYARPVDMQTMFDIAAENSIKMTAGYESAIASLTKKYGK